MSEAQVTRLPRAAATPTPSVSERIRQLQAEAAALSRAQLQGLMDSMIECARMAAEVSENPSQPAGARDLARRLIEEIDSRGQTLTAINARS